MPKTFFSDTEQEQIMEAIRRAELNTSGEIRVHIEAKCENDPYERATSVFGELGMQHTRLKNGVLIYVAYTDRKFAIVGDSGIHEKVAQQFWNEEKELMLSFFRQGKHAEGLCRAIAAAGQKLKIHFPYQDNDTDELSNEISFGKGGHD